MKKYVKSAEQANGVFWVIDGELFAYPFYDDSTIGLADSGMTFNHRRLWPEIAPQGVRNKSFDYYPRGRVEFNSRGIPTIYMNPNIDESLIPEIKKQFGLITEPKIYWDYSKHYRCHLDDEY